MTGARRRASLGAQTCQPVPPRPELAEGQKSADIKEFPQCRTPSACQLELADSGQFPEKKVHVSTLPLSNWRSGSKQSALPVEMDSAFFAKFREALAKYSSA